MSKQALAILAAIIIVGLVWVVRSNYEVDERAFDANAPAPTASEVSGQSGDHGSVPPLGSGSPASAPGDDSFSAASHESRDGATMPGQHLGSGEANALSPEASLIPTGLQSTGQAPEASDAGVIGPAPEADGLVMESLPPEYGQPTDPGLPPEASDPGVAGPAPEDDT